MERYIACFESLSPISLNPGPKSVPSPFTMWQVLHCARKISLPCSAFPFFFSSTATSGTEPPSFVVGRLMYFAASSRMSFLQMRWNTSRAASCRSFGILLSLASASNLASDSPWPPNVRTADLRIFKSRVLSSETRSMSVMIRWSYMMGCIVLIKDCWSCFEPDAITFSNKSTRFHFINVWMASLPAALSG